MFDSVLNTPLELSTIFAKGSILMFEWVLDTPLTYMFKEKQKLRKTCKLIIFKNVAAAKTKQWFLRNFWENFYWEISKFCKKFRSSHQKCSIKKAVLENFVIFTGKDLCWKFFLIKSQDWRPTTLLKRDFNTGIFLWILRNF